MLSPNQIQCLNEYYERTRTDLYFCCERHDCDYEQMQAIVAAIDPLMPGRNVDYIALLNGDPIASDPLLIQCNQTIGRLDEIYCQLRVMFRASQSEKQIHKRTTVNVPPDWANPSFSDGTFHHNNTHDGTEKIETTTIPNQERFKFLDSAMKCLDRSLKIQITLTNRREKLQNKHKTSDTPHSIPNRTSPPRSEANPDSPLRGLEGMRGIQGYRLPSPQSSPLAPREENRTTELTPTNPVAKSGSPGWSYPTTGAAQPQEASQTSRHATNNMAQQNQPREEEPVNSPESSAPLAPLREPSPPVSPSGSPGWSYSRTKAAQPQEASAKDSHTTNILSQQDNPREEEPVTSDLSAPSAPPRETQPTPDPTVQFGPPKQFTENPNIAAVRQDPYGWRKEYKARRTNLKSASILSATPASPRETSSSSPEPAKPAYHQRE